MWHPCIFTDETSLHVVYLFYNWIVFKLLILRALMSNVLNVYTYWMMEKLKRYWLEI